MSSCRADSQKTCLILKIMVGLAHYRSDKENFRRFVAEFPFPALSYSTLCNRVRVEIVGPPQPRAKDVKWVTLSIKGALRRVPNEIMRVLY